MFPPPLRLCQATRLPARYSLPVKLFRVRRLSKQLLPISNRRLRRYRLQPSPLLKLFNLRFSRSLHPPAQRHRLRHPPATRLPVPPIGKFLGRPLLYPRAMLPLLKLLVLLSPTRPLRHLVSVRPPAPQRLDSRRIHSKTQLPIDLSSLSLLLQHLLDLRLLHSRTRRHPRLPRTWLTPHQHRD